MFYFYAGLTYMVYPGAVHSRFEHSLGVFSLAGEAVHRIKAQQVRMCHSEHHSHHDLQLWTFVLHTHPIFVGFRARYR